MLRYSSCHFAQRLTIKWTWKLLVHDAFPHPAWSLPHEMSDWSFRITHLYIFDNAHIVSSIGWSTENHTRILHCINDQQIPFKSPIWVSRRAIYPHINHTLCVIMFSQWMNLMIRHAYNGNKANSSQYWYKSSSFRAVPRRHTISLYNSQPGLAVQWMGLPLSSLACYE